MTATFAAPPPSAVQNRRPPPRWGVQTGLVQVRKPAFWLFVGFLFLGLVYGLLEQVIELVIAPAGWLVSWLLLALYIVPIVLAIRWLDLYEREPRSMLIGAFMWGALPAGMFSGFGNEAWGMVIAKLGGAELAYEWSAALTAPVVEEIYKYSGIVLLYLIARAEFDDLIDGFVYGALVGLGFAVAENVYYFIFMFGGDVGSVLQGFWIRVVAGGLYGHVTFTGIAGVGFAYFVTRRLDQPLMRRLLVAGALLLLAMGAHFVWNSPWLNDLATCARAGFCPEYFLYGAFKGLPFLIGLIVLLYLARRRENAALGEILATEVGRAGLAAPEMEVLRDRRSRRAAARRVKNAAGPEAERVFKDLQREQIKLALVASGVESADDARLLQQRAVCESLRLRLWQMPGAASVFGVTPEEGAAALQHAWVFTPDRLVGPMGAWAWATPNQGERRRVGLAPGLQLDVIEERPDGWVLVRSQNGWFGWTGAPYLSELPSTPPPPAAVPPAPESTPPPR